MSLGSESKLEECHFVSVKDQFLRFPSSHYVISLTSRGHVFPLIRPALSIHLALLSVFQLPQKSRLRHFSSLVKAQALIAADVSDVHCHRRKKHSTNSSDPCNRIRRGEKEHTHTTFCTNLENPCMEQFYFSMAFQPSPIRCGGLLSTYSTMASTCTNLR